MFWIFHTRGSITYLLLVLFLSTISCKTRHVDSEPLFTICFVKQDIWKIKKFCFTDIYGKAHRSLDNTCIDTINNKLSFPLNIKENSCQFIFQQAKKSDTLELNYEILIGRGDNEFKADISNFKIGYSTFDSLTIEHSTNVIPDEVHTITIYL